MPRDKRFCRDHRLQLWRNVLVSLLGPILLFLVSMSFIRYLDSHIEFKDAYGTLMRMSNSNAAIGRGAQLPVDAVPQSPHGVAPAGDNGAGTVLFGKLEAPPEKTLYVFSDPHCPACQQFESHLLDLERDFKVVILPVAYQGDDGGDLAANVLCAPDRGGAWRAAISGKSETKLSASQCAEGYLGVQANMEKFRQLGFNSTPRVVVGTGKVLPERLSAALIRRELSAGR